MARIRSIHPSLFTDEAWVSCSPLARILYIGLMCDADDQGLFEWKPLQIKMRLLPGDTADIPELLDELVGVNLIARLDAGGKHLGAIRYFRRFQRPKKPNAHFMLPPEWRTYVGLGADGSELGDDDGGPVPNQFPTEGEKSPQMEDGGGRVEGNEDADASSARPPKAKPRKRPTYPDAFEQAWRAYPHHEGRSSKPASLAEWERLPEAEAGALLGCIERFRPNVERVCGGKGAPCMSRWLKDGKHLNWMPTAAPASASWAGPDKVTRVMDRAFGPEKGRGYLSAYCTWQDVPFEALVVSSPIIADMICKEAIAGFEEMGARVLVKGRAA